MRNSTTQTVSILTNYEEAFAYISNPLKQKEWAINFMKDVKETDHGFLAITPFGQIPLAFQADERTGIIDLILGDSTIPTRLLKNGNGCTYLFTLYQPAGMPDIAWEKEGIPSLVEELQTLKTILENG